MHHPYPSTKADVRARSAEANERPEDEENEDDEKREAEPPLRIGIHVPVVVRAVDQPDENKDNHEKDSKGRHPSIIAAADGDEKMAVWFERLLYGTYRPIISTAPRELPGLKKLEGWQLDTLATNLDVTTALTALGRDYADLHIEEKCRLIQEELESCHKQWSGGFRDEYWTPLMREYIKRTTT